MILANLVKVHRAQFAALAQAWMNSGATAFEVWEGGRTIAGWANGRHADDSFVSAGIGELDATVGELRVYGQLDTVAETRLSADSALIGQWLQLERELQSMTADLVASQDQLVAMFQMSQSLRRHLNVEETLQSVIAETVRMARAKRGFAIVLHPNGIPLVVQHPPNSIEDELIWQTFWHAHANEGQVLLTEQTTPGTLPAGVHNLFFAPLHIRGAMNGGIGLMDKPGNGFTAPDMKLIHAISQQASAHIENVLLYQENVEQTRLQTEVELAQRVQLQLLPQRLPKVAGLDLYAHSRPASQVGGDFYDFVLRKHRPFIFVVGDVTGKGLSAALLMTMARTAVHSKASFMPNPTPEIVMRNSNEDLYDDFTQVGMFATTFIGQYDPEQRRVLYANAGHSPVIYRPVCGRATLLQADSAPIGVLNTSLCRNHELPFGPGDLLVIGTDGFTDARNDRDEMFGYERLIHLIDMCTEGSAKAIAESLFEHVGNFSSGRLQDDDQTLVVVKGV